MTDTKNLLPCPMCGCSNITVKNEQPADNSGGYFIECPECGISTNLCYACGDDPIPLLAELWNHRVSTQCLHQIAEPAAPHAARDLGLAALEQYLKECEENQIVADVGGAFAYAWQRAAAPQAVQPAVPVIFVSREQLESHTDHLASEAGRYLPARKTAVGKFTMPLYAHPAEAVQAAVSVDVVSDLKNALADAAEMQRQLRLMEEHARGDVWRWQADAANELASMGNRMGVLILASDLRNLLAAPAHPAEGVAAQAFKTKVFQALGIGSACNEDAVFVNIENARRRADCLSAIEREFFMVETPPDESEGDTEPGGECLLNWGHPPTQYVQQFAKALAATQPAAQGMDAQDAECLEIGRELNRACVELPWGYEIILYLEQGAGTVHWMDQDGNEHDIDEDGMFSEKIGYAIAAAQAKQGGA